MIRFILLLSFLVINPPAHADILIVCIVQDGCSACDKQKPDWNALQAKWGGTAGVHFGTLNASKDRKLIELLKVRATPTTIFAHRLSDGTWNIDHRIEGLARVEEMESKGIAKAMAADATPNPPLFP